MKVFVVLPHLPVYMLYLCDAFTCDVVSNNRNAVGTEGQALVVQWILLVGISCKSKLLFGRGFQNSYICLSLQSSKQNLFFLFYHDLWIYFCQTTVFLCWKILNITYFGGQQFFKRFWLPINSRRSCALKWGECFSLVEILHPNSNFGSDSDVYCI